MPIRRTMPNTSRRLGQSTARTAAELSAAREIEIETEHAGHLINLLGCERHDPEPQRTRSRTHDLGFLTPDMKHPGHERFAVHVPRQDAIERSQDD